MGGEVGGMYRVLGLWLGDLRVDLLLPLIGGLG